MATNRPPGDPNDPTRAGTTTTQPGVTTGTTPGTTSPNVGTVGSVGVYDQEAERHDDASLRHTSNTSTTRMDTHGPAETRSGMPTFAWIIGAIVLILLIYFLLQWLF